MEFAPARRDDLIEDLFGQQVADPYRWLEDASSPETVAWSAAQDSLAGDWLAALPGREQWHAWLVDLLATGLVGVPAWRGERAFFLRRGPDQEHAVLILREPDGAERVLIDPSALDPDGTTTLDAWQPDKEGRRLAYQLSRGGTEESTLAVLDVDSGQDVEPAIDRTRYSPIAWLPGGESFFYVRRQAPGEVPPGEEQYHRRVRWHRLGTNPDDDPAVFGEGYDKTAFFDLGVSRDGRWLTVTAALGTAARNDLWLADLTASTPGTPAIRPVVVGLDARVGARVGRDGRLYVFTDLDAPRGRICVTTPQDPAPTTWRTLVDEDPDAVLDDYAIVDGPAVATPVLVIGRIRHAVSELAVHDLHTGVHLGDVALPGLGSLTGIAERPEGGHEVWVGYTDHARPPEVLHVILPTRDEATAPGWSPSAKVWAVPPGVASVPEVAVEQVTYTSKDGTPVRMFVLSPPGLAGPAPTVLYGYGGFDIALTPSYGASALAWVRAGGRYAIANIRGGSEEGEQWHREGMRERKQNVFDDFISAARWLITSNYSTPDELAISGGSNGGLLVGAVLTQQPALFASVVCSAPLLDMARYELHGLGQLWSDEYGSAAEAKELSWLLAYSPYHAVREGVEYPAILFTIFDSDTRVDPLHARKMCAALQHATTSGRPILLRREAEVGHGARSVTRTVTLSVDVLAFLAKTTGLSLDR